jgi:lipid-A-disaccharide synthase
LTDLALVAGEASGDWIGARVVEALCGLPACAELSIEGIAGPRLKAAGVHPLYDSEALAVRGYVEVVRHLPRILGIRRALRQRWSRLLPRVFLGIDAPDFNLGLALQLRRRGIATVQLVCPAFWAWRADRIDVIRNACDHVLCIFPFEPVLLERAGIPATFIGHPLAGLIPLDVDTLAARRNLNIDADLLIGILPGSRSSEIQHLGQVLVDTVQMLQRRHPRWRFVTPLVPGLVGEHFRRLVPTDLLRCWTLLDGRSHEAMAASDALIVASGTATLEAALFKKPMVITYKVPALSYWFTVRQKAQSFVGLPNILAGESLVPELLQEHASAAHLTEALETMLADTELQSRLRARFTTIHHSLLRGEVSRGAEVIGRFVQSK